MQDTWEMFKRKKTAPSKEDIANEHIPAPVGEEIYAEFEEEF
jgi:hypothetical protein